MKNALRIAVMLMALIAAACLAGTLVVQRSDDPHEAIARYYGSWWFIGLLVLLVASTAACAFSGLRPAVCASSTAGLRPTRRRFVRLLVHGSILLIAAGAVVSRLAGVEGQIRFDPGESVGEFKTERGDAVPLGFKLRLDGFAMENFQSRVSVLDQTGRELRKAVILVNSPLKFGRYTFYQQGYDWDAFRRPYPVLLVKRDPGVPLVLAGFALLPVGIALALYAKPQKGREEMFELFWKISFAAFLAAVPLTAGHALIALSLKEAGEPQTQTLLRGVRRAGNALIALGLAALTAAIAARWIALGHPPFSNMAESLLWMAWTFCAVYFVARHFVDLAGLEFAGSLGAAGILAASTLFGHTAGPLMPALRSNWLIFHVFTCMVSYGAFFAAFCIALLWLTLWRKRESQQLFDALIYQVIAFGFLMLTIGIVSGAAWGNQAWGRYWGWDPKETWALITWLVYAIYLHLRPASARPGVRPENLPRLNALFAVGGFAVLVFTYVGVNYLLRGLHSYARG